MRKAAIACFAVLDYTKQRILVECSQVVEEEKTDMIFGEKTEEQKRVAELPTGIPFSIASCLLEDIFFEISLAYRSLAIFVTATIRSASFFEES